MNILRHIGVAALIATSAVSLSGCGSMSYGQKIEADNVSKIVKGKTTRDEVLAWFGQPMQSVMMPDGGRTMYWVYYRSTFGSAMKPFGQVLTGKNAKASGGPNLSVVLDSNGIVKDFEYAPGG